MSDRPVDWHRIAAGSYERSNDDGMCQKCEKVEKAELETPGGL